MAGVSVRHLGDDRFAVDVRGHTLTVDQPAADGGTDTGPTPTELFVAGLAACVAFYVERYLTRHDLPTEGLLVTGEFTMASRPARVAGIRIDVRLPEGVPDERRPALLAVARRCTVHNSLAQPPQVSVELVLRPAAAA